jgi:aryl-alcohol dehydrogenase-like predicted oxidoreductase
MINSKIILGTAQFGMDYGINNTSGKITKLKAFDILNYAFLNGIKELDTASSYGDSEKVIGEYLNSHPKNRFIITTKISDINISLEKQVFNSLENLRIEKIDKLLFHSYDVYRHFEKEIKHFYEKYKGLLFDEFGVSTYTNHEMDNLINDPFINRIQSPFNILDNYNKRGTYFEKLYLNKKKVDVRSVFLQGIFFKNISDLQHNLIPLKKYLNFIRELSKEFNIDINSIAFGYLNSYDFIDRIIFGVDSLEQLKKNLKSLSVKLPKQLLIKINSIEIEHQELLNPSKW